MKGMDEYKTLLDSYESHDFNTNLRQETVFDICGFPHYEQVISNVLAYFLDSSQDHGFGELFIKSLFQVLRIPFDNFDMQFQVDREVRTDNGGFIDILLKNDSATIVIENKIYADLYNDLQDYLNHAKKDGAETCLGVVLSLKLISTDIDHFQCVTYPDLISKIRENLGVLLGTQQHNHFTLLIDFIKNMEWLATGESMMNKDFIDFVKNNYDSVEKLGADLKAMHDSLRSMVKDVNSIVIERLQDPSVKQWPWRELPKLYDVAVSDFVLKNGISLAIDSVIDPRHWEFQVFPRRRVNIDFDLVQYCMSKGISGKMSEHGRYVLSRTCPITATAEEVSEVIVYTIKALKD